MPRTMTRFIILAIAAAALTLATGCGSLEGEKETNQPKASKKTVEIFDFKLRPQELRVGAGTRVTWVNKDPVDHTVTAEDGSFDKLLKTGDKYSYTFKKKGTFRYKDRLNVQPGLRGKVTVE